MIPRFTPNNSTDAGLRNAVPGSNLAMTLPGLRERPNPEHVIVGELSVNRTHSNARSTVSALIQNVVFSRVPSKIRDVVVERIAVVMASIHAFRARSNKRFKYESMYSAKMRRLAIRFVKNYAEVSTVLAGLSLFKSSAVTTSRKDPTIAGNGISGVSRYRFSAHGLIIALHCNRTVGYL